MTYLDYLCMLSERLLTDACINLQGRDQIISGKKKPKTNFVEVRTFLHLYRSFDRMWVFFILSLQVILNPRYLIKTHYCRHYALTPYSFRLW